MVSERKRRQWKHEYDWQDNVDKRLEEKPTHFNKKKNTKKWCKGKRGTEHTPILTIEHTVSYEGITGCVRYIYSTGMYTRCKHQIVCSKCHKIIQWWFPKCPEPLDISIVDRRKKHEG